MSVRRRRRRARLRAPRILENYSAKKARKGLGRLPQDFETLGERMRAMDDPAPTRIEAEDKAVRRVERLAHVVSHRLALDRRPRQLRLDSPLRAATVLALEKAAGKPIGRRTREKLKERIPAVMADALCARKRKRREVLFARKDAGKGRSVAARRPRQHRLGRC